MSWASHLLPSVIPRYVTRHLGRCDCLECPCPPISGEQANPVSQVQFEETVTNYENCKSYHKLKCAILIINVVLMMGNVCDSIVEQLLCKQEVPGSISWHLLLKGSWLADLAKNFFLKSKAVSYVLILLQAPYFQGMIGPFLAERKE